MVCGIIAVLHCCYGPMFFIILSELIMCPVSFWRYHWDIIRIDRVTYADDMSDENILVRFFDSQYILLLLLFYL